MASKSIDWDELLLTADPKKKEIEVSFKKIDGEGYISFGDPPGTPPVKEGPDGEQPETDDEGEFDDDFDNNDDTNNPSPDGDPIPPEEPPPECEGHECNAFTDFYVSNQYIGLYPTYTLGTNSNSSFSFDREYPFPIDGYNPPSTNGSGAYGYFAKRSAEFGMVAQNEDGWQPAILYYRPNGLQQPIDDGGNVYGGGALGAMPLTEQDRVENGASPWTYGSYQDPDEVLNCGDNLYYTAMQFAAQGSSLTQNSGAKPKWCLNTNPMPPWLNNTGVTPYDDYKTASSGGYAPPALAQDYTAITMYQMSHAEYLAWARQTAPNSMNAVPDSGKFVMRASTGGFSFHYVNTVTGSYQPRDIINVLSYLKFDFDFLPGYCKVSLSQFAGDETIVASQIVEKDKVKGWVRVDLEVQYAGAQPISATHYKRQLRYKVNVQVGNFFLAGEFTNEGVRTGDLEYDTVTSFYHPYGNGASDTSCPTVLTGTSEWGRSAIKDSSNRDLQALCLAIADPLLTNTTESAMRAFDRAFRSYVPPTYCQRIP